jgi:hypothetical protein
MDTLTRPATDADMMTGLYQVAISSLATTGSPAHVWAMANIGAPHPLPKPPRPVGWPRCPLN